MEITGCVQLKGCKTVLRTVKYFGDFKGSCIEFLYINIFKAIRGVQLAACECSLQDASAFSRRRKNDNEIILVFYKLI